MINTAPAVIVGADLNGLGIVRSLARGSVPAIILDTKRWHAAMWSRFARTMVADRLEGRGLIDSLLKLQRKLTGRPVLYLTNETAVNIVSEFSDDLRGAFRFNLPPRSVMATLANKARFFEFAEQNGLPVPQSVILKPDTPLAKLASLSLPVVIKSAFGQPALSNAKDFLHPIFTLKDAEVLCRRLLEFVGEIVVQEWISGPESNVCFAMFHLGHKPENFKVFTGRKLASDPAKSCNPTLCLPAPEVMDALEPIIAKYLDVAEFQGLGSLAFKWDMQQRRYAIIGHTVGYTDWQGEIATLCGVNLPLAAYRDEVGLPPISSVAVDRTVAWRESALARKDLPMLSPGTRVYDGYWRTLDPLPGLFFYTHTALGWANRRIVAPILGWVKRNDALDRMYQGLVKTIFQRNKASAR